MQKPQRKHENTVPHWLILRQPSYRTRTTCLEVVLPTMGWALLHQLSVKTMSHSHAHYPIWSRRFVCFFFFSFEKKTLICVELTIKTNQVTVLFLLCLLFTRRWAASGTSPIAMIFCLTVDPEPMGVRNARQTTKESCDPKLIPPLKLFQVFCHSNNKQTKPNTMRRCKWEVPHIPGHLNTSPVDGLLGQA